MKRANKMKMHLRLLASLIIIFGTAPSAAETLRIATGEWPPYASDYITGKGAFTEIISETLKEMGAAADYRFYPWKRTYQSVKTGAVWAAFPFAHTEDREGEVLYSDPVLQSTAKLFYYKQASRKRKITFETFADLKDYRVIGVSGYYYESLLRRRLVEAEYVTTPEMAIEQLHAGRADLFISNELVGWHIIRAHYPDEAENFATLAKPFHRHRLYLIASRKYPDGAAILERFNAALDVVKNRYFYGEMLKKLRNYKRDDQNDASR